MRLADGPSTEATTTVAATPELVWEQVTDLGVHVATSDELQHAEWLDGADGPAEGARFRGRNHRDRIGTWETTSTVVECAFPTSFAWAVGDRDRPTATWRFHVAPREEARGAAVDLTGSVRLGPGGSNLADAVAREPDREEEIVARRVETLRRALEATVAGIRDRLEGPDRG